MFIAHAHPDYSAHSETRDDEYYSPSERASDPPEPFYGPPPHYAHFRARFVAVFGESDDLFARAWEEGLIIKAWERRVAITVGEEK